MHRLGSMARARTSIVSLLAAAALASGDALAENEEPPDRRAEHELQTGFGVALSLGTGFVGFLEPDVNDVADVGGSWDARVSVGTRRHVAGELGYTGVAQSMNALGLDNDAVLISTGVEAAVRGNLLADGPWQPYALAGLGWRRYDLIKVDTNTSSVRGDDTLGEIPLGLGFAYRDRGLLVDVRTVFRVAFAEDLIADTGENHGTGLHTWEASVRLGWEL